MDNNKLIDEYYNWLKDNTIARELKNGAVEITTPFLDRHNDSIQIYVSKDDDLYTISDDCYTLSDLELSGLNLNTPKRQQELNSILVSNGIKHSIDGDLYCECGMDEFAMKKHDMIRAILTINDLNFMAQANVSALFSEDIRQYFIKNNIRFTADINLSGESGLTHKYDFVIPQSSSKPDRFISAVNRLDSNKTKLLLFAWKDIKPLREESEFLIFINENQKISATNINALRKSSIKPMMWEDKDKYVEELSA